MAVSKEEEGWSNNIKYQSIEIGEVDQPNILVPLHNVLVV